MAEHRDADELFWLDPPERGIIPLDGFHVPRFHVPRRFQKTLLATEHYQVAVNHDFEGVMRACASSEAGRKDTWINDEIIALYSELNRIGHAHSVEVRQNDQLIGGLYGVSLGAAFFGESMFSLATGGSKLALAHTVGRLIDAGYQLFDTQFYTDHLGSFGCVEIPRERYHQRLREALKEAHRPLPDAISQTHLKALCSRQPKHHK